MQAPTAKTMQGNFIGLAHNLCVLMSRRTEKEAQEVRVDLYEKHMKRKKKRISRLTNKCEKNGLEPSNLLLKVDRLAELPIVFFRWLREYARVQCSWIEARRPLLIGNRFWPSGAFARSLKPKACIFIGAE